MTKNYIVELTELRLLEGVDETSFLKAVQKAYYNFFRKQKGFISRNLLKAEGNMWVDIMCWKSREEAKKAADEFPDHASYFPFIQMVSPIGLQITQLEPVSL